MFFPSISFSGWSYLGDLMEVVWLYSGSGSTSTMPGNPAFASNIRSTSLPSTLRISKGRALQRKSNKTKYVVASVCLSACLSLCSSVCRSVGLPVRLFVSLSHLSLCLSLCLSHCLSLCLSLCLFFCLSLYLSICLSVSLSLSLRLSVRLFILNRIMGIGC